MKGRTIASMAAALAIAGSSAWAAGAADVEWPFYGGSEGFNRYSPLNVINPQNVGQLKVLWTRPALDASLTRDFPDLSAGGYFKSTPIEIGGVLYAPNGVGLVEAFDARTGKTIWVQQPFTHTFADATGGSTRGVAYWKSSGQGVCQARLFNIHRSYLYALDVQTGKYCTEFGEGGRVDLRFQGPGAGYGNSGGPLVVGDVIVLGGTGGGRRCGDGGDQMKCTPEAARGYDARTGKLLWTFSPMPAPDDPARASWAKGSADIGGSMGAYGTLSADPKLGYVYIPFTSQDPPAWGGWRPGDNLYGNTLVCLDAKTGKLIWYYQMERHDLWNYDLNSPPVLGDITVNGKRIKAVMQTGKVPLLFTLDRVTGKPVWPVEERSVPQSTVPDEHTAQTQPFPTRPAPLAPMGVTLDDLIDFTPQLHQEALEILTHYTYGPAYTPPTIFVPGGNRGSLNRPPADGDCNWNCGSFDPETGTYYTIAVNVVTAYAVEKPTRPDATMTWVMREDDPTVWNVPGPQGLPLVKPPYGALEAIDMNRGEYLWKVPNGDGPRDNPALKDLHLPPLGIPGRAAVLVTKSLIFVGESSSALIQAVENHGFGNKFRAYDKHNGQVLTTLTLPAGTTAAPITYSVDGEQVVIVSVGGNGGSPQWVALGL
jgi:quinoprotein glucose dehydrogenase